MAAVHDRYEDWSIACVRAGGHAAGEVKHGPIALVEPGAVVIGVAADRRLRSRMFSNLSEMKPAGATVMIPVGEDDGRKPPSPPNQ